MFRHEKQFYHPVGVEKANLQYAVLLQAQLGGGNGERKAAMPDMRATAAERPKWGLFIAFTSTQFNLTGIGALTTAQMGEGFFNQKRTVPQMCRKRAC